MSTSGSQPLTQIKVSIRPELATAFRAACAANNEPIVGVLSGFMEAYSKINIPERGYTPNLSTKRQRRTTVCRILSQLARIKNNEENYRDNIPANLQDSEVFQSADHCIALVDEAIEALKIAYMAH